MMFSLQWKLKLKYNQLFIFFEEKANTPQLLMIGRRKKDQKDFLTGHAVTIVYIKVYDKFSCSYLVVCMEGD